MIQTIADTINGWVDDVKAFTARIVALAESAAPDFSPITAAGDALKSAFADLDAAIKGKETPGA